VHCLLVEDNEDLAATVADFLSSRGMVTDVAGDGMTAMHLLARHEYDAVVLDLGLPDVDGLELCRRLRESSRGDLPVLMLTARDTEADKLAGFAAGTDDYLVKPFSLPELAARLAALERRARGASLARVLEVADLRLDLDALEVRRAGAEIHLPPIPMKILALLMRNTHRVVSRRELEAEIWGDDPPESGALKTHIHTLRSAIDHPFAKPLLRTVPGSGYRLAPAEAAGRRP
jgi:DNA-binding response OmpR family regulator